MPDASESGYAGRRGRQSCKPPAAVYPGTEAHCPPCGDDGHAVIVGPARGMAPKVRSGQAGGHCIGGLQAQAVDLQRGRAGVL